MPIQPLELHNSTGNKSAFEPAWFGQGAKSFRFFGRSSHLILEQPKTFLGADNWSVSTQLITKVELPAAYERFCRTTFAIKITVFPLSKLNMQIMDYQHILETNGNHRL